jgi:hypothetical protein
MAKSVGADYSFQFSVHCSLLTGFFGKPGRRKPLKPGSLVHLDFSYDEDGVDA